MTYIEKLNSQIANNFKIDSERSFREVFRAFYIPLVNYANTFLNNADDAEDIIQEVFVNIWEKADSFNNVDELKPYLYRAVRNKCLNFLRDSSLKNKKINALPIEDSFEQPISNDIIREEVYLQLMAAFNTLPSQCKKIYQLSLSGMKASEIAEELELSVETVKSQKKRAKKLLIQRLGKLSYLFFILFEKIY